MGLQGWGLTEIRGADAEGWLNDLVTASIDRLAEGEALRSFLLSPTGRIRADVFVLPARAGEGFLLLQGPGQPDAIADLLAPYVLSSEVELAPSDPSGLAPGAPARPRVDRGLGGGRRGGHGRPGGPGVVADPPRSGPLPGRPGPGFAARRGRARRGTGDRSDQGLLPRPGVGCTGAEPRAPAAGGARGASRDPAPARLAGPFERGGRGVGHQRGAPRRPRRGSSVSVGTQGKRSSRPTAASPWNAGGPRSGDLRYYAGPDFSRLFSFEHERYNRVLRARTPPGRLRQPDEAAGG